MSETLLGCCLLVSPCRAAVCQWLLPVWLTLPLCSVAAGTESVGPDYDSCPPTIRCHGLACSMFQVSFRIFLTPSNVCLKMVTNSLFIPMGGCRVALLQELCVKAVAYQKMLLGLVSQLFIICNLTQRAQRLNTFSPLIPLCNITGIR